MSHGGLAFVNVSGLARRIAFAQSSFTIGQQQRCLSVCVWSNLGDKNELISRPQLSSPATFQRSFSNTRDNDKWIVPKSITIPEDRLDISFARASGAGGQNVNKVETKVEVRFDVMQADWIPLEVRERILQNNAARMNKDGYLNISSQEFRTQLQNRKKALAKLEEIILKAYPRPVERKLRQGISKASKERNLNEKKRRSDVKQRRKPVDF